jgi:hypothetical protein
MVLLPVIPRTREKIKGYFAREKPHFFGKG